MSVDATPITATPFTLSVWVRPSDVTSLQGVFWIGDKDSGTQFYALILEGQAVGDPVTARAVAGTLQDASTSTSFVLNTWQHLCGVFASATDRRVFLNGGGKGTNTTSRVPSGLDRVSLGRLDDSTPTDPFSGQIAEAAIWSVALNDDEVVQLARGHAPTMVRAASVIAYWPIVGRFNPETNSLNAAYNLALSGGPMVAVRGPPVIRRMPTLHVRRRPAPSGTVQFVSVGGTLSMAGVLSRTTARQLAGGLTMQGVLGRQVGKGLTGVLQAQGSLTRGTSKALAGTLSFAGALASLKAFSKLVTGTLSFSGGLTGSVTKALGGTLVLAGSLTRGIGRALTGTLSFAGAVTRRTSKLLTAVLTMAGVVQAVKGTTFEQPVGGQLTFGSGTLQTEYIDNPEPEPSKDSWLLRMRRRWGGK